MNLLAQKFSIPVLAIMVSAHSICAASIENAYRSYLAGSYEKSLIEYREVYNLVKTNDALYGIINSLVALKQYDEALALSEGEGNAILTAKKVWILGLINNKKTARKVVESLPYSRANNQMIFSSGGYGFQNVENYSEAVKWFEYAHSIDSNKITSYNLSTALKQKQDRVIWTGTALAGSIIYSSDPITDHSGTYSYSGGTFFEIGSRWDISKKHSFEMSYSRFDASFNESFEFGDYRYGINYESTLYHSLDSDQGWSWETPYSVSDSLSSWLGNNSEQNKYSQEILEPIVDSVTEEEFDADTAYYLYEEVLLDSSNTETYDEIVTVKDSSQFTPNGICQNSLYVGYSQWYVGARNFHLGGALSLFNSNMYGMKKGGTFYLFDSHIFRKMIISGHWYGTFTEGGTVLQSTPEVRFQGEKVGVSLLPTYVYRLNSFEELGIEQSQFSMKFQLSYSTEKVTVGTSGTLGKRVFVAESGARNLVTVGLPHKFTGTANISVRPSAKRVTIFTLLRYENYEQMSRLVALAGLALSL